MKKTYRLLSWNVNGIRAIQKKGFLEWFKNENPDMLCLQETKAHPDQLDDALKNVDGYESHFSAAEKKGYSGVVTYTKLKPKNVQQGIGIKKFDSEGRFIITEFDEFTLFNIYFPNGKASEERLQYKMEFYETFLKHCKKLLKEGKKIVVCSDVNTAHKEIDLARPKENSETSGFLPQERAWILEEARRQPSKKTGRKRKAQEIIPPLASGLQRRTQTPSQPPASGDEPSSRKPLVS